MEKIYRAIAKVKRQAIEDIINEDRSMDECVIILKGLTQEQLKHVAGVIGGPYKYGYDSLDLIEMAGKIAFNITKEEIQFVEFMTEEQLEFLDSGAGEAVLNSFTDYWEQSLGCGIMPEFWMDNVDLTSEERNDEDNPKFQAIDNLRQRAEDIMDTAVADIRNLFRMFVK